MSRLRIIQGDALEQLTLLPDESVQCCVTSPPYWGLRDYGVAGQLGLENTPEEYVAKMVAVFREVRRVLREDGTCWINIGDSYAGSGKGGNPEGSEWAGFVGNKNREKSAQASKPIIPNGLKPKDLCGIPWRLAFALQADGWWLRQDIIWHKPNPMPESVTDRCTKSHEYIFLLTKSARYFYDAEAVKEPASAGFNGSSFTSEYDISTKAGLGTVERIDNGTRNKRSVWTVPSAPYSEAHFATFPPDLIKPCILAGTSSRGCCPKCGAPWDRVTDSVRRYDHVTSANGKSKLGPYRNQTGNGAGSHDIRHGVFADTTTIGWNPTCVCYGFRDISNPCTVLDPFGGSGTTGMVALELGRKAILIELNPEYVKLAEQRCFVTPGLALA